MKYLISLAIIIFCCGFTLCDKMIRKHDGWELYIYPDCSDSTTYIKEVYSIDTSYKEKRTGGYFVKEGLYIHDSILREFDYHCTPDDSGLNEPISFKRNFKGKTESSYISKCPSRRQWDINDSVFLYIDYYQNGTIKSYRLENDHNISNTDKYYEHIESIEWDTLHQNKWKGLMKSEFSYNKHDTVYIEDETDGMVNNFLISQDSTWKTGRWRKYNSEGVVIDSTLYK